MDSDKLKQRILIVLYMSLNSVFLGFYGNIDQMNEFDGLKNVFQNDGLRDAIINYAIFLKISTAGSSLILFSLFLIAIFQFQFRQPIKIGIFIILSIGVVLIIVGIAYGNFFIQYLNWEYFNEPIGYGIAQILIYLIAVIELIEKDKRNTQDLKGPSIQ